MNLAWRLSVLVSACCPAVARADEPPVESAPEMEAPFALTVNTVPKGDIVVVLAYGDIFVDRADLLAAGIKPLGGEDAIFGERPLLRMSSVRPPLEYELDEREIALHVTAPPEWLGETRIDLTGRPPEVAYRTDTSAFFNYAPRLTDDGHVQMYEETGLSVGGALLFSSAYLSDTRRPVRGLTNVVVDDRVRLHRYTFGDALVPAAELGSGGFVGGVTLSRTYELDPYAVKVPSIGMTGATATPATLDVIVNGARVHSQPIEPGTFKVDNILVGGGLGAASYVIRDVFGNAREVRSPFYVTPDALAEGVEEYTYSAGVRRYEVGTQSWDYERRGPVAYALHRRGLTDAITLAGRAEANGERLSAGPTLTVLAPFGQIDLALATSRASSDALGGAARLGYSFTSRRFGAGVACAVTSHRYSTVELAPADDRPVVDVGASMSVPIAQRVTLSYRTGVLDRRDAGLTTTIGGQVGVRVTGALQWTTSAARATNARQPTQWEVITTLSLATSGNFSGYLGGRVGADAESVELGGAKNLPQGEGFGYRGSAQLSEQSSVEAALQYQALFGRYGATYRRYATGHDLALDAAGAVVVVPGAGIFPTLPVQGAFGLIRVPGVRGVRGYGNHQELGRTDAAGNLIVPNLISYYGNHLSIAPEDVPIEYQLETTSMTLAPPPRGVALAELRARTIHYYRGRIVIDTAGKRSAPTYGQLTVYRVGDDLVSPLGEQGEFDLEGAEPGVRNALIEWPEGTCKLQIEFAASEEPVIDLGELVCHAAAPAPE